MVVKREQCLLDVLVAQGFRDVDAAFSAQLVGRLQPVGLGWAKVVTTKRSDYLGTEVGVLWGAPGHRQKLIRAVVKSAPDKEDRSRGDLHAAV